MKKLSFDTWRLYQIFTLICSCWSFSLFLNLFDPSFLQNVRSDCDHIFIACWTPPSENLVNPCPPLTNIKWLLPWIVTAIQFFRAYFISLKRPSIDIIHISNWSLHIPLEHWHIKINKFKLHIHIFEKNVEKNYLPSQSMEDAIFTFRDLTERDFRRDWNLAHAYSTVSMVATRRRRLVFVCKLDLRKLRARKYIVESKDDSSKCITCQIWQSSTCQQKHR